MLPSILQGQADADDLITDIQSATTDGSAVGIEGYDAVGNGIVGLTIAVLEHSASAEADALDLTPFSYVAASELLDEYVKLFNEGTATIAAGTGIEIDAPSPGSGTFTTIIGMNIANQCGSGITHCYAIETGTGLVDFGDGVSPGIATLAVINSAGPIEGYIYNCSNCNTPTVEGAVCATGGDGAGAVAIVIRSAVHCF
jgi:hypothetical protein